MTNQASEDDLATNIDKIIEYWDFSPIQDEDSRIKRVHKELEALIRAEKLKLLAEVKERVIGEDLPPDVATESGKGYSRQQFAINMGKAGQRATLTKMEAEL